MFANPEVRVKKLMLCPTNFIFLWCFEKYRVWFCLTNLLLPPFGLRKLKASWQWSRSRSNQEPVFEKISAVVIAFLAAIRVFGGKRRMCWSSQRIFWSMEKPTQDAYAMTLVFLNPIWDLMDLLWYLKNLVPWCAMFGSGFCPKIYKAVKGVPVGNRSWKFLEETVSSKCLSTMLGIRSQRLQTAGMGRLDMRYRCFGAVPFWCVMGKVLIHLLLVRATISICIVSNSLVGPLEAKKRSTFEVHCDWIVSSCNCTLIKGVCFQTSCLAVSNIFLETIDIGCFLTPTQLQQIWQLGSKGQLGWRRVARRAIPLQKWLFLLWRVPMTMMKDTWFHTKVF